MAEASTYILAGTNKLPGSRPSIRSDNDPGDYGMYKYASLPTETSIRVLDVLPSMSDSDSVVSCEFRVIDLGSTGHPAYDALSYTWGLPCTIYPSGASLPSAKEAEARTNIVLVDGKVIKVTKNCVDALKQLRSLLHGKNIRGIQSLLKLKSHRIRPIWIDALCINQAEDSQALKERAQQIRIMRRVYSQALEVKIWLGLEDCYTRDAVRALLILAELPKKAQQAQPLNLLDIETYKTLDVDHISPDMWLAVFAFLHRSYFRRAWIVQEVAVVKDPVLICGAIVLPWHFLASACYFMKESRWNADLVEMLTLRYVPSVKGERSLDDDPLFRILAIASLRLKFGNLGLFKLPPAVTQTFRLQPLGLVVNYFRRAVCGKPQDKIYAYLGVAEAKSYEQIQIDYQRPVEKTYVEVARVIMLAAGNARLLSFKEDRSMTGARDLPSWVPDLYVDMEPHPFDEGDSNAFKVADDEPFEMVTSDLQQRILTMRGFCIGTISAVARFQRYNISSLEDLDLGRQPSDFEALWRCLIGDKFDGQTPAPPRCGNIFSNLVHQDLEKMHLTTMLRSRGIPTRMSEFRAADEEFKRAFAAWQKARGEQFVSQDLLFARRHIKAIKRSMDLDDVALSDMKIRINTINERRTLFRTREDQLGNGPRSIKENDEVWVLAGTKVPYVLRPVGSLQYELVGEAFIHGVMYGEACRTPAVWTDISLV
ncbi:hypothetical protein K432DRAFT_311387 [Lepidopterella palustris CBS 459.81]|uniref:Heterokaryon incompatibility domain-containing protein n=1 Tax=Lepidopterella palustris CBS 459.81 TaxID=1314670 RepID=A0A8E2DYP5_9PEZI|nr:hypothetical protein K432DRAFT_311387 [Lepidopterella palustris CBS 459.81]